MESHKDFDLISMSSKIYPILLDIPETRDNDRILIYEIWTREIDHDANILESLKSGKVSHPENITRTRRKLQEKHPILRGEKWDERHRNESNICQQLTFFDLWAKSPPC